MRTVAGPAGRSGMARGVDPTSRLFTNTRAPDGRDSTPIVPVVRVVPAVPIDAPRALGVAAGSAGVDRTAEVVDAGGGAVSATVGGGKSTVVEATGGLVCAGGFEAF